MLTVLWNVSASLRGYLRFHIPTNRAVDWLRTPAGMKWAIPVAVVAVPAYLFAMSICATLVEQGGPGYVNCLVVIFGWNSIKFAGTGLWVLVRSSRLWLARSSRLGQVVRRDRVSRSHPDDFIESDWKHQELTRGALRNQFQHRRADEVWPRVAPAARADRVRHQR